MDSGPWTTPLDPFHELPDVTAPSRPLFSVANSTVTEKIRQDLKTYGIHIYCFYLIVDLIHPCSHTSLNTQKAGH